MCAHFSNEKRSNWWLPLSNWTIELGIFIFGHFTNQANGKSVIHIVIYTYRFPAGWIDWLLHKTCRTIEPAEHEKNPRLKSSKHCIYIHHSWQCNFPAKLKLIFRQRGRSLCIKRSQFHLWSNQVGVINIQFHFMPFTKHLFFLAPRFWRKHCFNCIKDCFFFALQIRSHFIVFKIIFHIKQASFAVFIRISNEFWSKSNIMPLLCCIHRVRPNICC